MKSKDGGLGKDGLTKCFLEAISIKFYNFKDGAEWSNKEG